jgi:hypothetical protein
VKHLLPILAIALATSARADVLLVGPSKDATIFQNNVNNSNGEGPGIFAGTNGTSSPRRGLISFDLSLIPAGSIITDVQLTLTLGQIAGSGGNGAAVSSFPRTISLYELTQNWGEGTTGNTSALIGGTGQGFAAGTGDATWNSAAHSVTLWNTPGGDYNPTASSTLTMATGAVAGNSFTWLSTETMVADVQGWLNSPSTNFGWIMINADETGSQTFFSFYTSEWGEKSGGNAAQEPVLQITYTVPEPTACALAGLGALALFGRRTARRFSR